MLKAFRCQSGFLFRQKSTQLVMLVLFILVAACYITDVFRYQGSDVIYMIHPMKLLLLSYDRVVFDATMAIELIRLYPLLAAAAAGLACAKEKELGLDTCIRARIGGMRYSLTKLAAVFFVTTVVFLIPFLSEIVLNCVAFPMNAAGGNIGMNIYDPEYVQAVRADLFPGLYLYSPYLYAVIRTILFALLSGVTAAFTAALSMVVRVKYRMLYLIPPMLLFYASENSSVFHRNAGSATKWYHYIFLFDNSDRDMKTFFLVLAGLVIFSGAAAYRCGRRDCLS